MSVDRTLSLLIKFGALDKLSRPMKAIGKGSRDAGKELSATRKQLAELERAQARIGKAVALQNKLRDQGAALRDARADVARLAMQMDSAEQPSKELSRAFAKATAELERLEKSTGDEGQRLAELRSKLSAAGVDLRDLAGEELRLGREIQSTNSKLKQQGAELQKAAAAKARFEKTKALGESVRSSGYGMVGAGVAIGAPLAATVDPYQDFQSGLTDIAQKADLSRAKAEQLGATLVALAPKVGQLPEALRGGVDDLLGKGLGVGDASRIIAPIGRAATAYKAELSDLTSASYAGIDNLKVPIADVGRQLDIMAAAGKAGSFEMKDMATYFPMLTASAQGLGQKGVGAVADLAAALQITRKGAGDASTAANNLQNLMNKINTKDTIKNFKEFGVDLVAELKKAEQAGKSPIEAISELTSKALGGDMSKLSFLFGDAQVQAALRPLIGNLELYRKIRADALAANGTAEGDFLERMNDDAARSQQAMAKMNAGVLAAGRILSPIVTSIKVGIGEIGARFASLAESNPLLAKGLLVTVAAFAGLLVVCGTFAVVGGTLITTFAYAGAALSRVWMILRIGATVFRVLTMAMAANPVLALAIGIGVAVYLIWSHWASIKSAFSSAVTWIRSLNFASIGRNLLLGLINGLNPLTLVQHIMGLGGKAITALKGVLGIKSPSRVFASIGGFMTEGLALGIDRGGSGPVDRVRALGRSVATAGAIAAAPIAAASPTLASAAPVAAAIPTLAPAAIPRLAPQAAGPAAPAASATYNLHLSLPAGAAQDPASFAREVMKEIERLERNKARSSYRDD